MRNYAPKKDLSALARDLLGSGKRRNGETFCSLVLNTEVTPSEPRDAIQEVLDEKKDAAFTCMVISDL